jgi:hypothetical protein
MGHEAIGGGALPSSLKDRVSQLAISPQEQAMARTITITHEQLRQIDRPIADYLYQTSRKEEPAARR